MLFTSSKFLGGRNVQQPTTIRFRRSAGSGLGQFLDRVDITDPKGYTKLGTGSFRRDDVISGASTNGTMPVELVPATYSLRVTAAKLLSSYSPFNSTLDGTFSIRVARVLDAFTFLEKFDDIKVQCTITDTDNEEFESTKAWFFEDYQVSGTGEQGSSSSFPFTLFKKLTITNADATRITYGTNNDDSSMALCGTFSVPASGSPLSADITFELIEGFDFS